jgi:hypothetical protein
MELVNATPRPLYPRERPGTHFIGGWVRPRASLDGCGKSRPIGIRSPDREARSESLYRLSYPGPQGKGKGKGKDIPTQSWTTKSQGNHNSICCYQFI